MIYYFLFILVFGYIAGIIQKKDAEKAKKDIYITLNEIEAILFCILWHLCHN